jgi:hypothetical protein
VWNAAHGWISFKFQFGRVVAGGATLRYLGEFFIGQLALTSPFILVLCIAGLARETRWSPTARPLSFTAAMVWPALAYFLIHALHSRVQGNWPSFIYPALAVLAASAVLTPSHNSRIESLLRLSRVLALPAAATILAIAYLQAFTGILPMGKSDPIARMTAVGLEPVAREISELARENGNAAIVTTKYATASWLAFYIRPRLPVIEIAEDYRWLSAPAAGTGMLHGPLLYVTQSPSREMHYVAARFSSVRPIATLSRMNRGVEIDRFYVYVLSGFHGAPLGRVPNA